jgi:hypothetical protein
MNLQAITEQYRQFQRRDLIAKWDAPLEQVLEVFFSEFVDKDYSCNFEDMLPKERLGLYTLFDLSFMSDEQCELHVLEVEGKPLGIAHKFADKSQWGCDIIDAELFKVVARELAIAALDKKLTAVTASTLDSLGDLRNGYIRFLDDAETMFVVHSPVWMYGFDRLPERHAAFYVDGQGTSHPVVAIGKFVDSRRSHDAADRHEVAITLAGDVQLIVDGTQLMFELIKGKADLAAALKAFTAPSIWCVGDVFPQASRVVVYQHEQFRCTARSLFVEFFQPQDFNHFVSKFFAGEVPVEVAGVFDLPSLRLTGVITSV